MRADAFTVKQFLQCCIQQLTFDESGRGVTVIPYFDHRTAADTLVGCCFLLVSILRTRLLVADHIEDWRTLLSTLATSLHKLHGADADAITSREDSRNMARECVRMIDPEYGGARPCFAYKAEQEAAIELADPPPGCTLDSLVSDDLVRALVSICGEDTVSFLPRVQRLAQGQPDAMESGRVAFPEPEVAGPTL